MSTPTDGPVDPFGHDLPLSMRFRRGINEIPDALGKMARFTLDNPAQMVVLASGAVVLNKVVINLVKPKTPIEALACMVILQLLAPYLAMEATKRGALKFKIRDQHGCLVPWEPVPAKE